ncbi:hypothetical protein SUGI_1131350 [Cryptomeria japonica]|uniref:GCN5-related N-acetyltransferase 4, chloroplastic isoform X2 n=1 Tax=Cryptomeria japonica TaxID=3369 RepID=UPI0024148676|nr:GCN5-related N-acetyltransferase 4, chloroplastic isoform X2 [Cryptomeria japonica]GLJ53094.1 hypothetical protein SUGI_1131350 [Cryptomeria japonica]
MQAFSSFSLSLNIPKYNTPGLHSKPLPRKLPWHQSAAERRRKSSTGAVQYLPAICPDILVREARPEDYWEVAETHCSSFFPDRGFPMDLVLRADRLVAMFAGFSIPAGCRKQCLVAIDERLTDENTFLNSTRHENVEVESKLHLNGERISGILTIDTVAEFLPRRGHLGLRRTGIAYISNVAVRQKRRRRGIAQRLVIEAEALACSWGCRSMALHCDVNNPAALALYQRQGFRCIKVPTGAKWPQPKAVPGSTYHFMMKLLSTHHC